MPSNRRPISPDVYIFICGLAIYLCLYACYEMRLIRTFWPRVCSQLVFQSFLGAATGMWLAYCMTRVFGRERHLCNDLLPVAFIAAMVSTTVTLGVMVNRSLLSFPGPINPPADIHVALA